MSVTSLRVLAAELNLSHATVSEALRGSSRVKESTRLRVVAAAERLGYRRNPLASALMTAMRRSRNGTFRGTLALFDPETATSRPRAFERYHAELLEGASRRAGELGFRIDRVTVKQGGFALDKISSILHARGIRGLFILPACAPLDLSGMDWSALVAIRADCANDTPHVHAVHPDHARALAMALDNLRTLGYIRPGLLLDKLIGPHQIHAWAAAFQSYFLRSDPLGSTKPPSPLITPSLDADRLDAWLTAADLDVVVAYDVAALDVLRTIRPDTSLSPAFCCLNMPSGSPPLCAGLDLQARSIGRRAIELLIDQVLRNEGDTIDPPVTSLISSVWLANDQPATPAYSLAKG